ncbi:hypothetical protein BC628DRAFT_1339733 [Trametes gibbosa]|nr:hypothetical protein BC628DRAFT_1339733 [Trametes gibbosa]
MDANGVAIKFFIQKDIPQEIQAEVCETIASLGGRVESKVPRAGFMLVQPGTAEEERLRLCWTAVDRPERYIVPYTYVEACKVSGMLLKQIFIHEGQPIPMHIDSSIANVNVRSTLSARIMHSGGDPTASAQSARVILADPNTDIFNHLVKTYQGEAEKYVESYLWVKKCIEKGQVIYTPVVYKNPGGRRPGEERTQFTQEDEKHLCDWIAAKIPYKETGGRTGNRLYQQLCEMSSEPEYAWVTRHTWQSWRERYKKNATRLDTRIQEIVEQKKPAHGEKGQYGYVRKPEEKPKRTRRKARNSTANGSPDVNMNGEVIVNGNINVVVDGTAPIPGSSDVHSMATYSMPMPVPLPPMDTVMGPVGGPGDSFNSVVYQPPAPVFQHMSVPTPGPPMTAEIARQNAREEEMEDDEDDWQIREGNAPTPNWAKRKLDESEEPNKRQRIRSAEARPKLIDVLVTILFAFSPSAAPCTTNGLHVIDQAVRDIAKDFRFLVEEVQEYYDKCGDPERTRNRFKKMREVLNELPDDEPIAV